MKGESKAKRGMMIYFDELDGAFNRLTPEQGGLAIWCAINDSYAIEEQNVKPWAADEHIKGRPDELPLYIAYDVLMKNEARHFNGWCSQQEGRKLGAEITNAKRREAAAGKSSEDGNEEEEEGAERLSAVKRASYPLLSSPSPSLNLSDFEKERERNLFEDDEDEEDEEDDLDAAANRVLDYLSRRLKADVSRAPKNLEYVKRWLKKGVTEEQCTNVIDNKIVEWGKGEKRVWLRPSTIFGGKFEEYVLDPHIAPSKWDLIDAAEEPREKKGLPPASD